MYNRKVRVLKSIRCTRLLIGFIILFSLTSAQQLEIHHINVGQADATFIKSPTGVTMLIDGGNRNDGTNIIYPYLTSLGVTKLNYIVCSHYHGDHLGGLDEVIYSLGVVNVDTVFDRGRDEPLPDNTGFSEYETAANATGRRKRIALGQILNLGGGVTMQCVATNGEVINYGTVSNATSSENDLSIGWLLNYESFQYFTGGDLGGDTTYYADNETPLAAQVGDVDAMKINHHGSRYSTNHTFLDSLKPEVAFISVGDNNFYGHPTQTVLNRLVAARCFIYQTQLGAGGTVASWRAAIANTHIILRTSGTDYTVTYGRTITTYPGDQDSLSAIAIKNVPGAFFLAQNYPNPFNSTTTIAFQLSEKALVRLAVYNVKGHLIETLVSQEQPVGYYNTIWSANKVPTGLYIYRIDAGSYHDVRKCIILK